MVSSINHDISNINLSEYLQIDGRATDELDDHSVPNVSLNVSAQKTSDLELQIIALLGSLFQVGVVAFSGTTVLLKGWNENFEKAGNSVKSYAFPMMASGTVLLTLGMFLCAYIIDRNTKEERWIPSRDYSSIWPSHDRLEFSWLQRGIV